MAFGKELIIDLYECDAKKFNRRSIRGFMVKLCELIDIQREDLHFWDYKGVAEKDLPTEKYLLGTSAVQFITTSNITIHTLDLVSECYINIFSCKKFNIVNVAKFSKKWFEADRIEFHWIIRGRNSKV